MPRDIAIILAAGESTRMGQPKALLPAAFGQTFLSQIAERCRKAGLLALVVTGAHAKEIRAAHPKIWQVVNRDWKKGQLSSVLTGLRAAALARRVVIQPVDAPFVLATTYRKVARSGGPVACAAYRGKAGHPVAVDAATARTLLKTREKTLAAALDKLGIEHVKVNDPAVLENINERKQLKKQR